MLSDGERETLREVERRLLIEDPGFARSFTARARRLHHRNGGVGIKIFLAAGSLLSAIVLVAGAPGGAVALAATIGLIWLAWRRTDGMDQPPPS